MIDRRLFTSEGELREKLGEEREQEQEEEARTQQPATTPVVSAEEKGRSETGFQHRKVEEPEGVDFTMLLNAMAQPALLFLGEIAHPASGDTKIDLEQAQLQIDLLELLRVKCRGNLTSDEDGLLDRILYQLRMLYVARSNQPAS